MPRNLDTGRNLSSGLSLNILTDDELEAIHLGTLELLAQTGVWMEDTRALELMTGAGADVNPDTKIVKIPPHVVEGAIRSPFGRPRPR
jgi:trimethylamine--corrinoid protein Co-methyltransferase